MWHCVALRKLQNFSRSQTMQPLTLVWKSLLTRDQQALIPPEMQVELRIASQIWLERKEIDIVKAVFKEAIITLFWANTKSRSTGTSDASEKYFGSPPNNIILRPSSHSNQHHIACGENRCTLCMQRQYVQYYWPGTSGRTLLYGSYITDHLKETRSRKRSHKSTRKQGRLEGYYIQTSRIRLLSYQIRQHSRTIFKKCVMPNLDKSIQSP